MANHEVFRAKHRYARISARKARLVMDLIRDEPVESALYKLRFCPRRAAPMIRKVVRAAIANATQAAGVEAEELVIWRAFVDEGPTMKRWRPRAMGRAFPRLRRSCHLSVELRQKSPEERARDEGKKADTQTTAPESPAAEVAAAEESKAE